jgi:hypothetical protein
MGIRQVPSGLSPALDGFLRDLRQAVEGGIPQSVRTEIITAAKSAAISDFNNGFLPPGAVQAILDTVFGEIANDPNWKLLADRIDVINGPASLPESMRGQLASTRATLEAALNVQGSSITTLQTITATQATQITTLQTNVGGNSSAIISLSQTTATQATQIQALGTRMGSAESTIVTMDATTKDSAAKITTLQTKQGEQSASIQQLFQTTTDLNGRMGAQWTVKTDVNGRVAGIGLFNDGNTSSFYVRVDRFAVGDDSTGARPCFAVQNGNVYIQKALIGEAWIDSAKIADAAITNAKIQSAAVDTLKISGNSVTTVSYSFSGGQTACTNLNLPIAPQYVILTAVGHVYNNSLSTTGGGAGVGLVFKVNGNTVWGPSEFVIPRAGGGAVIGSCVVGVGSGWFQFCAVQDYTGRGDGSQLSYEHISIEATALLR